MTGAYVVGMIMGMGLGFIIAKLNKAPIRPRCPELTVVTLSSGYGDLKRRIRCEELDCADGKPHDGPCCAREGLNYPYYWEPGEPDDPT